jgi:hypothetical protein
MSEWRAKAEEWITEAQREEGQALAEVAVIIALVLTVCVAALGLLGIAVLGGIDGVLADAFP